MAPDVRIGNETWIAAPQCKADGSAAPRKRVSAFLPFKPASGRVYFVTLDLEVTGGGNDWLALAFCKEAVTGRNIHGGSVGAMGWMLSKHKATRNGTVQTFVGPGARGMRPFDPKPEFEATRSMKIVLDARAPQWQVTWFANRQRVRGPVALPTDARINYLGLGSFGSFCGKMNRFRVTESVHR